MSDFSTEHCLIFLSDADFKVLTEKPISNNLRDELLKNALPQGSTWKTYAGARSIAFSPLKSLPHMYVLSYSVVTNSIETPILSFIIILNRPQAEKIITHQIQGIENAFIRRMDIFASLDIENAEFLRSNIVAFKEFEKQENIGKIKARNERNQILFVGPYNNPHQWRTIELSVSAKSANSLLSFRTLALQKEMEFQVLGLVASVESNKEQSSTDKGLISTVGCLLFLMLVIAIALFIIVYV